MERDFRCSRTRALNEQGITEDDDSLFGELLRLGYDDDFEPHDYCEPTKANPGSLAKLHVLTKRLEDGVTLFHDDDEKQLATIAEQKELAEFAASRYDDRKWINGKAVG